MTLSHLHARDQTWARGTLDDWRDGTGRVHDRDSERWIWDIEWEREVKRQFEERLSITLGRVYKAPF